MLLFKSLASVRFFFKETNAFIVAIYIDALHLFKIDSEYLYTVQKYFCFEKYSSKYHEKKY